MEGGLEVPSLPAGTTSRGAGREQALGPTSRPVMLCGTWHRVACVSGAVTYWHNFTWADVRGPEWNNREQSKKGWGNGLLISDTFTKNSGLYPTWQGGVRSEVCPDMASPNY